jgi:hypothetical protein
VGLEILGRLKPGVRPAQAEAVTDRIPPLTAGASENTLFCARKHLTAQILIALPL